ncbi:MAG: hypothetical protein ABMB14_24970 [Myxococcota bacterium]
MIALAPALLLACNGKPEETGDTGTDGVLSQPDNDYPLPPDISEIDFPAVFQEAVRLMATVTTQDPWRGHAASMDVRQLGCPDFWTGTYLDAGITVGHDDGVSWNDGCATDDLIGFDGWVWWTFDVQESGDADSYDGRISDASRTIEGNGLVSDEDGVRFEFDGSANDTLYEVRANGYHRYVYSSSLNATVTGRDVFAADSPTPRGYRSDLYLYVQGGDVDNIQADGNVYLFEPTIAGRFDSIGVDMALQGPLGAAPDACTLEPLGWIGLRDADAYWYDVVFLPRSEENIIDVDYPNDPLSVCDGCGRLYVQGIDQGVDVCVDFSFLFDEFGLPDADDYVLPMHAL